MSLHFMYPLYSLLLAMAALLTLPWWLLQMARHGKYRAGLAERLGFVPKRIHQQAKSGAIWVHAVSVGEVLAVSNLVRELEKCFPSRAVVVSTTTAAGQRLAREKFGPERVFFAPLDFGFAIGPYIALLRPELLVLAETEFWPNLLRLAKKGGASLAVVNARISDRSLPRYCRFRWFFQNVLRGVDLFLAQSEEDARRLREIGAPAGRVAVSGNLKFDIRPSGASRLQEELRRAVPAGTPILVCGSTAEGEEGVLLKAFSAVLRSYPSAVMVLAPRHPERFDKVAGLVGTSGLKMVRRSRWTGEAVAGRVFLLDTVGELASVYALATVAFVGGSLVPTGGHNILEPAQHGVAVLTGPHTFNFREIVQIFEQGGGLRVASSAAIEEELLKLLGNPEEARNLGIRARELFNQHTGATQKTMAALRKLLPGEGDPQ